MTRSSRKRRHVAIASQVRNLSGSNAVREMNALQILLLLLSTELARVHEYVVCGVITTRKYVVAALLRAAAVGRPR